MVLTLSGRLMGCLGRWGGGGRSFSAPASLLDLKALGAERGVRRRNVKGVLANGAPHDLVRLQVRLRLHPLNPLTH